MHKVVNAQLLVNIQIIVRMLEEENTKPDYNSISGWKVKGKGGFRASCFIYGFGAMDNMGFVANMVSMVLYFMLKMHFDLSGSANTLTNFMGSSFLLSIVGGLISDTLLTRFHTCLIFGMLEILGLILMTIQARFESLQAEACGKSSCVEGGIALLFYVSLCVLALGTGGVRGALPALGADQFDQKDPTESKALGSYFNYMLLTSTTGAAFGVTLVVWVSTNKGWWLGFLISTIGTIFGFVFLAAGRPFYRLQSPGDSPILRIIQVIVVSIKNRKLTLPENPSTELYEVNDKGTVSTETKVAHTDQFRFLDKAAIPLQNSEPTPWTVCTVTQVEEVKVLTRMLPIIGSTIIMNTCLTQLQTFSVQQGYRMNRLLGSFEVPSSSVPVIPLIFMVILIPLYDRVFVPFAAKLTGRPSGVTQLQRVGVGLVLSAVSMAVAAMVEVKRKEHSLRNPLKPIHVMWLAFQYGIFGVADMFTLVGLLEFYYKEAPAGMRSLSTSFTWISLSFGYFLSSVFVGLINAITKALAPSKKGWLEGQDLDKNNLALFYWFLAILSCFNFANYLYWALWYKYKSPNTPNPKPSSDPDTLPKSLSLSRVPFLKASGDDNPSQSMVKSQSQSQSTPQ
nr:protein NRT1/ PTR FAMILY 4.5-like [Ipomoea batatas]